MIAGDDVQRLDEDICDRYPYPLVATYDRALFQAPDPAEAHEYLLDLFEVTLKYCTAIALAQYFHDRVHDAKLSRDLAEIERPSLGHWSGWLRDILALYRRDGRALAIPELDTFHRMRHAGAVATAAQGMGQLMAAMGYGGSAGDPAGVSTQQFFDLLVGYRNRLAHGARPSTHDRAAVAELLAPALRQLYKEMGVLAEYRLVYVRSVTLEFDPEGPHRYRHVVTYLTGQTPRAAPNPTLLADAYPDKQLYLLDRTSEFRPLLSLHPFFIFAHCVSCNREQAFVLNMTGANSQDYLGYQCTHHFSPTEYLEYMRRLLAEAGVPAAPVRASSGNGVAQAVPPPPPPPPPTETDWPARPSAQPAPPVGIGESQAPPAAGGTRRRVPWLLVGLGAAALVVIVVLIVVLTRPPVPSQVDLAAVRRQYQEIATTRNQATQAWAQQVQALLQAGQDTSQNERSIDNTYANQIQAFDNALLAILFPSSMSNDVHALVNSDAAFVGDLRSAGVGLTQYQLSNDEAKAQAAINILQTDIGLGTSTQFPGPG